MTISDSSSTTATGQLARYLKAIRRRSRLIAVIVIVTVGTALALSLTATKKYDATSKVFINQTNPVESIVGQNQPQSQDPERDLNSKVALIRLPAVAQRVSSELGLHMPIKDLLDEVATEVDGTTEIVNITVTDPSPARAAAIANSFARQFAATRQEAARATIQQAVTLAQQQLNSLSPAQRAGAQGRGLATQLRQLQIAGALQTGGIETASPAATPTSPSSPKTKRNVAVAILVGLIFGLALAVAAEAIDRRIKDEDDLDPDGPPVLAMIPPPRDRDLSQDDFHVREAFSTLATNLRFYQLGRDVATIAITSPSPQEGKTTTTLGLSRALADLGLRVLTIECDLRRPMFASYLQLPPAGGLSTVLAGVADFDAQLVDIDATTFRALEGSTDFSRPYFTVLPAGPVPPNPQGLLSSAAMREAVRRAAATAEVVLLDTAPVGTVNDVVTLGELVDGVALLVRLGRTRRDHLQRAMRTLSNLPSPVLGFVVTNAERETGGYYGYDRPTRTVADPV